MSRSRYATAPAPRNRRPRGMVEYRGVSFAYSPEGAKVLVDIDLRIEPGMRLGVLGASGAGKSTLLALVPRLYDVPEGIDVHGRPWGAVSSMAETCARSSWPTSGGPCLVPQQALLFEGTIRTNLLYANPEATDAHMWEALWIADFADTVASLAAGLDTPVGERGYSLSGGQRQRLALARAVVAQPTVLLLDDCTSALDSETESRIQQALDRSLPGRTFVIVSHKVASVRGTDWIVVLEAGRIVEQGIHADLIAQVAVMPRPIASRPRPWRAPADERGSAPESGVAEVIDVDFIVDSRAFRPAQVLAQESERSLTVDGVGADEDLDRAAVADAELGVIQVKHLGELIGDGLIGRNAVEVARARP